MSWATGNPSSIERFRDATHASGPAPVLIPKRCACGKVAFAKQLTQYGKCVACVRAAAAQAAQVNA